MEPHFLALKEHITSDPERAKILFAEQLQLLLILGQLNFRIGQHSPALQYLQSGWDLVQDSKDVDPKVQIQILIYLGIAKIHSAEYLPARAYAERALLIHMADDWALALAYNVLGEILRHNVGATRSETLQAHQAAKTICEECVPRSRDLDLELAYSYRRIGRCLADMKDHAPALRYYNQALTLAQKYLSDSEPFIGNIYHEMGCLGLDAEHFVDYGVDHVTSRRYLDQSLSISLGAFGLYHYNMAVGYDRRSQFLYVSENKKDWELALVDRSQEIEIYTRIFGPEYLMLIKSYYRKGKILHKLQREVEEKSAYKECVNLGHQHPGKQVYIIRKSIRRLQELG
jgi:tetratricopeptide (TPR) repeat protein